VVSSTGKGPIRIAGADRTETAQLVARLAFPNGAQTVYIATSREYADALSAGPGAVRETAPILLTQVHELDANTAVELQRLRPARIVVVGGWAAVDDAVFEQLRPYASSEVVRVAGVDRFETAAKLSAEKYPNGAPIVYVATGRSYPDALAAGLGASNQEAPVLLTEPNGLPASTVTELQRLGADHIIIVGGTGAVSRAVEQQLAQYAGTVERISGTDRYGTTAAVNNRAVSGTDTIFVVTGKTFGDALTGIPIAALTGSGVLMVGDGPLHAGVVSELQRLSPQNIIVLGGSAAVAERVETELAVYMGDGTGAGTRGLQVSAEQVAAASAAMHAANAAI
jgi:putative cell wall-binding protein